MSKDARERWILYALLIVAMSFPLLRPLGIPLKISKECKAAYDYIESLPEGSTVWIDFAYRGAAAPESDPQAYAVMTHFFKKNLKVCVFYCIAESGPYAKIVMETTAKEQNKKYGVDYIDLGYKPDLDAALNGMARDFRSIFPTDVTGKSVADFAITKDIKDVNSFAMFFVLHTGAPGIDSYFKQIESQFKKPLVAGMTAVNFPQLLPRFNAGQLKGMVSGVIGAAEYELLVKRPGRAVAGVDAQSLGHMLIAIAMIVGNIIYLRSSRTGTKGGN